MTYCFGWQQYYYKNLPQIEWHVSEGERNYLCLQAILWTKDRAEIKQVSIFHRIFPPYNSEIWENEAGILATCTGFFQNINIHSFAQSSHFRITGHLLTATSKNMIRQQLFWKRGSWAFSQYSSWNEFRAHLCVFKTSIVLQLVIMWNRMMIPQVRGIDTPVVMPPFPIYT